MTRNKRTVYIEESLLCSAKVAAAGSGRHKYEVFEDELCRHLGLAGAMERIWAGISPEEAPTGEQAAEVAAKETAAGRAGRRSPTAS